VSGPRQIGKGGLTAFDPNGDSRRETATLLIGAARDADLDDARHVRATQGGFYISDELADLLYDEQDSEQAEETVQAEPEVSGNPDPEPEPEPKTTRKRSSKKASGNRAAKNSTTEQE